MGTINYKTSEYITLAIRPYDAEDVMNCMIEEYGNNVTCIDVDNLISEYYRDDDANAAAILDKYDFYYYHVTIEPGYYEGLSIMIENNFGVAYNDYLEKQEAQKEITQIKKCLHELNGVGFNACYPGWVMTYFTYDDTEKMIDDAIREMRQEAKATPTWSRYTA